MYRANRGKLKPAKLLSTTATAILDAAYLVYESTMNTVQRLPDTSLKCLFRDNLPGSSYVTMFGSSFLDFTFSIFAGV